jgi:hypothetical protein
LGHLLQSCPNDHGGGEGRSKDKEEWGRGRCRHQSFGEQMALHPKSLRPSPHLLLCLLLPP